MSTVRKENKRVKCTSVGASVKTRWGSNHDECKGGNENQYDLNETFSRNVSVNGVDSKVYSEHMKWYGNIDNSIILRDE